MIYYRIALQGCQSATWRWKSSPFTSLDGVLGVLNLYRCVPRERIRVFLSSSLEQMEEMLSRANQGLLWDRHYMNWIEVRRLEMELGAGGDHDCHYSPNVPTSNLPVLAWMKLRALRARGELVP